MRIVVRSYELDSLGHLNQAVYHQYAEVARLEMLRAAGCGFGQMIAAGVAPVLLESHIRHLRELRDGDEVMVTSGLEFSAGKTFRMKQSIIRSDGVVSAELDCLTGLMDLAKRRLVADPRGRLIELGADVDRYIDAAEGAAPAVSLRPATDGEIATYLSSAADTYVRERSRAGDDEATARRKADESYAMYFPGGRPAQGHLFFAVEVDGAGAGVLWIGPHESGTRDRWWVWDIIVDEAFRGRGIGRRTMQLAEVEARAHGGTELGLNVFGHNRVANGLYRSLGYAVTSTQMRKSL